MGNEISLSVLVWTDEVPWQKLDYIHYDHVKAALCKFPEDYKYSSAAFHYKDDRFWKFLVHCDG